MKSTDKISTVKTIAHIFAVIVIFLGSQLLSSLIYNILPVSILTDILFGAVQITITLLLLWVYGSKVIRLSFSDFRIKKPKALFKWIFLAVLTPVAVSCFFLFFTSGVLAKSDQETMKSIHRIVTAICLTGITAGITEEVVFRGYIMKLIELRWGKTVAAIAPSLAFGLMHLVGMELNVQNVLLLALSGTSVGIMFSVIAYKGDSVWASAIVHGIWNIVIIGGVFDIGITHFSNAIFTYTLQSKSLFLTGGSFGIEASLPAIAAYWIVIIIVLCQKDNKLKLL